MHRKIALASLVVLAATTASAGLTFTPNMVKYRDTSLPHATGRAGDSTIDAIALLGKDGTTDLTVTANGSIDKVQLKADGDAAVNYNNLSGTTFNQRLDGLAVHLPLQVQANVSSAGSSREDVVTADEIVKLRPDLVVTAVRAPDRAMPGLPFEVSATVRELNGDVGARADCVLAVNGVEVDRSRGIWVDARDSVTCKFAAVLQTMGEQTLTVSASNVDPGDWDDGNNSASATITIAEPFDHYVAGALEAQIHNHNYADAPWAHFDITTDSWNQWSDFYGTSTLPIDGASMTARYQETTDGTPVDDIQWEKMALHSRIDGPGYHCIFGYDDWQTDNATLTVCQTSAFVSTPVVQFHADRSSVAVAYISQGWDSRFRDANGNVYTWHTSNSYTEGLQSPHFGSSVSLVVTLTDGVNTIQAAPTIPLASYSRRYGLPYECTTYRPGVTVCTENMTTESGVRAVVVRDHSY
jgi:hypothetical protein